MEFELKGQQYRTAKLDVFTQLKVSRKLLPVLAGLMSEFGTIKALLPSKAPAAEGGEPASYSISDLAPLFEKVIPKIADTMSALSEEDTNAIIFPCLTVVSRQHGKGWTPVFTQGELMFDDIDLFNMLQMVGRVVGDSLGNFLPELPATETQTQ